jgi:hypothetical protein
MKMMQVTFQVVFYLSIRMYGLEHVNVVIKKRNVFLCIENVYFNEMCFFLIKIYRI